MEVPDMQSRKDEFRSLLEELLADLHRRITELEALASHPHEHEISWDTVVGECRKKHLASLEHLRRLDEHGEDSWQDAGADARDAVEDLRKTVEQHEGKAKSP